MTELILLTGFLGSGKTTLMRAILDAYKEKKVGVIVNEFGQLSIDGALIRRDGVALYELTNGSIFCACIKDNFLASLIEMSKKDLEYIFIEASGLADPANMGQILKTIASKTSKPYHYLGAVCIVDAENFLDLYDLLPALHNQVIYAGAIIINKSDLADSAAIVAVFNKLTEINPAASIHITSYCTLNIKEIMAALHPTSFEAQDSTNTFESRPKTFTLTSDQILSRLDLEHFLGEIAEDTYRIKGFALTDKGAVEISCVKEHLSISPWPEKIARSEIVVISAVGIKLLSTITKALDKHLRGKLHL